MLSGDFTDALEGLVPMMFLVVALVAVALSLFLFFWSLGAENKHQPYMVSVASFGAVIVYTMSLSAYLVTSGRVNSASELMELGPYNTAYLLGGLSLIFALVGPLIGLNERATEMWRADGISARSTDDSDPGANDGYGDKWITVQLGLSLPAALANLPSPSPQTGVGRGNFRFSPLSHHVPMYDLRRQPATA